MDLLLLWFGFVLRLGLEKRFGYAVLRSVAASLYVWLGRFLGVLGFVV